MKRALLLTLALVLGCQPPSEETSTTEAASTSALPYIHIAHGLYVVASFGELVVDYQSPQGLLHTLLAQPYVRGMNLSVTWRDIEPERGTTRWPELVAVLREIGRSMDPHDFTVKLTLDNGDAPDWLMPADAAKQITANHGHPVLVKTPDGYAAVAAPSINDPTQVFPLMLSTEPGYVEACKTNLRALNRVLRDADPSNAADPSSQLVRIVKVSGPGMARGGTIRLYTTDGFADGGSAFGWTLAGHLQAWSDAALWFATSPNLEQLGTRLWSWDLGSQEEGDVHITAESQLAPIVKVLEANHPSRAAGVRLFHESLRANGVDPTASSDWSAYDFYAGSTVASYLVASHGRHEWQGVVTSNEKDNMTPRFEAARIALFLDPLTTVPQHLQHTEFVEVHSDEVVDASQGKRPYDKSKGTLDEWYRCFDAMIRADGFQTDTLSAKEIAFWKSHPSCATTDCAAPGGDLDTPPPTSVCSVW